MIVDDHPVFREALAHALATDAGFSVVAQASAGGPAIELWQRHRPDVTLMDVSMAGIDGIAAVRRILAAAPDARILMLTSSEEQHDVIEALSAGAAGYITKGVGFADLLGAIREVQAGGRPVGETLARRLAAAEKGGPLSPREFEVLLLLREGCSHDDICGRLSIAERTVRAHVAAIKEKLSATSAAQCVARGYELGLFRGGPSPGSNGAGERSPLRTAHGP
jgi:DNA-binding NarL/FixJ family response regulator